MSAVKEQYLPTCKNIFYVLLFETPRKRRRNDSLDGIRINNKFNFSTTHEVVCF
jgi:hypothetical protein